MAGNTGFAGLEYLNPGDPFSSDGYSFQFENPQILDLLTNIGAVLHRHDAHAAMANPSSAPTLAVIATGGALPSSTTIYIQYTLTDGQGGESLPTTVGTVTTPAGYADPVSAPTAVVSTSAGTMLASTPMYAVSVTDGLGGETALGPPVSVTVPPATNAEVTISGLTAITNTSSGSASLAGWRLWRSVDGGNSWDLMSTGLHSTDSWVDTGSSAGDCSVSPLDTGTTGDTGLLHVTVPGGQPAAATFYSIYASTDGSFVTPCLLGTYAIATAGTGHTFTDLTVLAGQPPRVSRCYGGANKIDPDTDILNWTWKLPVATVGALPTSGNTDGDARVVLSDDSLHIWNAGSSSWTSLSGGTSGVSSFNTRTGAVTAASGDYTAAQVTNAADKSSGSQQAFTGEVAAPDFKPAGLTGATATARFVGGTTSGAPATGTFALGDFIIDQTGKVWICTTAGSPGTWIQVSGGGGAVSSVFGRTGAVSAQPGDYTAAQVTNAADKSSSSQQAFTGEIEARDFAVGGLTGATAAGRYVGTTTSGAPVTGTFSKGDWVTDQTGIRWTCTTAGSPGTWTQEPGSGGGGVAGVSSFNSRTGAVAPGNADYLAVASGGLTGATGATRYVGGTSSGAPVSGTFAVGDFVIDQTGKVWICTTAGTPGTWTGSGTPSGAAGGSLSGTYPNPTVATVSGHSAASVVTASASGGIPAWAASTTYAVNQLVTNGGNDYICTTAHTSGSTFAAETADWQQIGGSGGGGGSGNTSSSVVALGSTGAAQTVNLGSAADQIVFVTGTLTANCTITLSNRAAGCQVYLLLTQDGTGGRTLTISDGSATQTVTVPTTAGAFFGVLCVCPDATNIDVVPLSVPGPAGATGGVGPAGSSGTSAALQNGFYNAGDGLISAITINSSTGALTFTLAAANCYVNSSGGILTPVSFAGGTSTPAASAPASTKYAVVGVEMDTSGAITIIKGTDTATVLNTGSLIASNSPATSSGKIRVADIAVFNNAGTYQFGNSSSTASQGVNWIDRRPWCRGAYDRIVRTQNASAGNDYTISSTTLVNIDATNLAARIECSGLPVRIRLAGRANLNAGAGNGYGFTVDGNYTDTGSSAQGFYSSNYTTSGETPLDFVWDFLPSAGSHLIIPQARISASTLTVYARSTIPLMFTVEEIMRQNSNNGTA